VAAGPVDKQRLAVVYLARGADENALNLFRRFIDSYCRFNAGFDHDLFVIYKGFETPDKLRDAHQLFENIRYTAIYTYDDNFDIGAYRFAAEQIPHDLLCFLNTNSEILCQGWLGKLAMNMDRKSVGLVGATGSFESLWVLDNRFPRFPNVHLRSNAFLIRRDHAIRFLPRYIAKKVSAFVTESGHSSLTRRMFENGLEVLVVGRDGRGYAPQWWPHSLTFRQCDQMNLLVHDNVTRAFNDMPWPEKEMFSQRTWGDFIKQETMLILPDRTFLD
jgi:hypothetical protein